MLHNNYQRRIEHLFLGYETYFEYSNVYFNMMNILIQLLFHCLVLLSLSCFSQSVVFTDASEDFGLVFGTNDRVFGTGISFYDFNQDGLDDVSITGSTDNSTRFYISLGDTLVQASVQIDLNIFFNTSVLWVDYDNDHDLDLSATHDGGPTMLFENDGNYTLTNVSASANYSNDSLSSFAGAWADFDLDGDLDFYISNRGHSVLSNRNVFYENLEDGQFNDIADQAMVVDSQGIGYGIVFTDFDKDGYPDIYIANDKFITRNTLFRNLGNETFEDLTETSNTDLYIDGMGIAPGDVNRDGFEDLYVTNTKQSSFDFGGNVYLQNQTNGSFQDDAENLGLRVYKWGWGCSFADFNNDGHLDLFVANEGETGSDTNNLFINNGDGTFYEDTVCEIYHTEGNSFGSAVGDINDDGAMDILVVNYSPSEVKLWLNQSHTNNWVKFTLEGTVSNTEAIGSWVEVYTNGEAQYRYKRCGTSYCSQDGRAVHFGLGTASIIDSARIIWPSQEVSSFYNVSINQTHHFTEPSIVTAIINTSSAPKVSAYPNPNNGEFLHVTWTGEMTENHRIELITADGKVCKSWGSLSLTGGKEVVLSLPEISANTYFLVGKAANEIIWKEKLVLQ